MEFGDFRNRAGDHVTLDVKFTRVHPERVSHTVQPIQGVATRDYMQQPSIIGKIKSAGGFLGCGKVEVCDGAHAVGPWDVDPGVFRFNVSAGKSDVCGGNSNIGVCGRNCHRFTNRGRDGMRIGYNALAHAAARHDTDSSHFHTVVGAPAGNDCAYLCGANVDSYSEIFLHRDGLLVGQYWVK